MCVTVVFICLRLQAEAVWLDGHVVIRPMPLPLGRSTLGPESVLSQSVCSCQEQFKLVGPSRSLPDGVMGCQI